ncbi:carbon-nitrogen hydrolase [Staphylotrichum tortipilum]|uniref:Carbon-nitrogen hydrolase n=1 Tax=Staphylotrichum tortipilum TaxID=2831512 RepID=A0AAN6RU56_9PEZI|nr:carbon-nitrogen hydrolase [Staphylotrichum longicolle]
MRIGCLQFAPQVGDAPSNMARAEAVLAKTDQSDLESLDLLVLPEMAFSECYNALVVVDSDGQRLANYRKSFLYYTDATWAREGQGFYGGDLGSFGQVAMGICMDVNPYKFEAPWTAYEFAFHILKVHANLVILSTAWLTNDERVGFLSRPDAPDLSTLTYWVSRLTPVIRTESADETIVVFANRCGTEDEATYAGTSTVLGIKNGEVSVYGILGRGVEDLLVVDTAKPPFGKLINAAEEDSESDPEPAAAPDSQPEDNPPRPPRPGGDTTGQPTTNNTTPNLPPPTANITNTNTNPTLNPSPTAQPTPPSRPKLSLRTNLPPEQIITNHLSPSPHTPPQPTYLLSPPLPHRTDYSQLHSYSHAWTTPRDPPSAIPIFVDVYTPDEPSWQEEGGYYIEDGYDDGGGLEWDLLSPASGYGGGGGKGVVVRIAASPSIFVGGGLV